MGGHADRSGGRRDDHHAAIDADPLCLWGPDDVMQLLAYGERLWDDLEGERRGTAGGPPLGRRGPARRLPLGRREPARGRPEELATC